MKTLLLVLSLAFLPSCGTTDGLFVAYTGNGVELSNTSVVVPPGAEATTATGAGYDLKAHTAYITYADAHTARLKITGAGFGGGKLALVLEGGGRVTYDTKTGQVTTSAPVAPPSVPR